MSLRGRNPFFPRYPGDGLEKATKPAARKPIPEPRTPAKQLKGKPPKALRPKVVKAPKPIVLWAVVEEGRASVNDLGFVSAHLTRTGARRALSARKRLTAVSKAARVVKLVEG